MRADDGAWCETAKQKRADLNPDNAHNRVGGAHFVTGKPATFTANLGAAHDRRKKFFLSCL